MTREIGTSAGLLALLGLLVHMQLPHSDTGTDEQRGSADAASRRDSDNRDQKQEEIEGPWLATRAFLHAAAVPPQQQGGPAIGPLVKELTHAPEDSKEIDLKNLLGFSKGIPQDQWFSVVATVADPLHTHLPLFLDGQTEAIEQSMQATGWEFSQQWLPWVDHFDGNEPDINVRRAQRRMQRDQEELPGLLIFQGNPSKTQCSPTPKEEANVPKCALFVFLVPETVTGGISGPAFEAAMQLAKALSPLPDHRIGLLAPSFSGSFASLAELVKPWKGSISPVVYSGGASNFSYAKAFEKNSGLVFHSGILNSRDYQVAACDTLAKYGMAEQQSALLKEDEGGFAPSLSTNLWTGSHGEICRVETYIFPRDISHLRNAYQEALGNNAPSPYDPSSGLNFTIRDPNSGEDSIPTFSETQTPLTQDAALNSITSELRRMHTRAVFISATNKLDELFLLRALRQACPDMRVFIDEPDILYVTAADREALTGTVIFSSYPMSFEGDHWLDDDSGNRVEDRAKRPEAIPPVFSEAILEGFYNVGQLLLKDMKATLNEPALHSYKQPGQDYPGVWILTLNRSGFYPVDFAPIQDKASWFAPNPDGKGGAFPDFVGWLPPRGWGVTLFGVSTLIVLGCFFFLHSNFSGNAKFIWLAVADSNYLPRLEALLGVVLSLTALMWILASPCWNALSVASELQQPLLRGFIFAGALAPPLTFAAAIYILFKDGKIRTAIQNAKWRTVVSSGLPAAVYFALPSALFIFAILRWYALCSREDTGLFFRFRSLELYSGSSPALPLIFGCLIFFCFSVSNLKGFGLSGAARARLTINAGEDKYRGGFRAACEEIDRRIGSPWTLELFPWITRMLVAGVWIGLCLVILQRSALRAFELPQYNQLLFIAIAAILLYLTTKSYDLLNLWIGVKRFLDLIQIHPQRRELHGGIQRISQNWPRRTIWSFNRAVSRGTLEREMLYRLDWRAAALAESHAGKRRAASAAAGHASSGETVSSHPNDGSVPAEKSPQTEAQEFRDLLFDANRQGCMDDRLRRTEKLQTCCADLAGKLYDHLDRKHWADRVPDRTPRKDTEYCEDFVALQLCQYIGYLVTHIKRIAVSLSVSFLLLILLFNSYSPERPQLIARVLVMIFVLIGMFVWRVFSEMERDPVLSLITATSEGQLSGEFWVQLATLGSLPLLGILGHLFPSAAQFLIQWIAPGVQQLH